MSRNHRALRRFVRGIAPNAVWDLLKWIGGSSVLTAIGHFFWLEFHRSPVDWYWLAALMGCGILLLVWGGWMQSHQSPIRTSPGDDLAEVLAKNNPNNDEQIRQRNEVYREQRRKEEAADKAELYGAREAARQCEEERRSLAERLKKPT